MPFDPQKLRLTSVSFDNFKSLVDFRLELPKKSNLTVLIGLNGSGKSTVLQAIDFLGQQMRGDVEGWLRERGWEPGELPVTIRPNGAPPKSNGVTLEAEWQADDEIVAWRGKYPARRSDSGDWRCQSEAVYLHPRLVMDSSDGQLSLIFENPTEDVPAAPIRFNFEGSILSQLDDRFLPATALAVKRFLSSVHAVDLLSPELMRQPSPIGPETIGHSGRYLPAFLRGFDPGRIGELNRAVAKAFPSFAGLSLSQTPEGLFQLSVMESPYRDCRVPQTISATHVNDGQLRLIAILAAIMSNQSLLLLDEIENGVNPEVVEFLLDELQRGPGQVVVTTHSPVILNFLDDEVARESVIFLYKLHDGITRCVPFFSIPSVAEKLSVMGPGEAFLDTKLTELDREIATTAAGAP